VNADTAVREALKDTTAAEPWLVVDRSNEEIVWFGKHVPFGEFTPQGRTYLFVLAGDAMKTLTVSEILRRAGSRQTSEKLRPGSPEFLQTSKGLSEALSRVRKPLKDIARDYAISVGMPLDSGIKKAFILSKEGQPERDPESGELHDAESGYQLAIDPSRIRFV